MSEAPEISVVIPIFGEEETLPELDRRLRAALEPLGLPYEIVLVNDGSRDRSLSVMERLRAADPRICIVDLSRNFGHQLAITAGIDHARGRAVIVMDGDLQDPPEVLPELIARWRQGYEVVYAVRRTRREGAGLQLGYKAFYRIVRALSDVELPLDSGDFSLMDRRVVDVLVQLPERNRYVRGLRSWIGFRQTGYEYDRPGRYAGEAKYTLRRLLRLAFDGIIAFSDVPLRFATNIGVAVTVIAALLAAWTLAKRLLGIGVVPGFATITILVLFFGGVQLLALGILGEYVGRIYAEVKGRPRYVVRAVHGLAPRALGAGGVAPEPTREAVR
ncbi:MAG TPA: glycosyltransferase family 2 protein [Myxococcota bacterium]|nr:glycosyltransferase family 2 protein [Myxococcota bacterium]